MTSKSKDLYSMDLATFFRKFQEHNIELKKLTKIEEADKKIKSFSLKAEEAKDLEKKMNILLQKFNKIMRQDKKP